MNSGVAFERGLALRRELNGAEAIDCIFAEADDVSLPMHEMVTEHAWGTVWSRLGLDRRSRSILNLGMRAALNRSA